MVIKFKLEDKVLLNPNHFFYRQNPDIKGKIVPINVAQQHYWTNIGDEIWYRINFENGGTNVYPEEGILLVPPFDNEDALSRLSSMEEWI